MTNVRVPDPTVTHWGRWSGLMAEQFSGNYVPVDEENWKEMALSVMNSAPFNQQGMLSPHNFRTWQEWAQALARVNLSGV